MQCKDHMHVGECTRLLVVAANCKCLMFITGSICLSSNEDMKLGNILYAGAMLNIMALNINGLRKNRKKRLLGKLLRDLNVGAGIIPETHLRTSELRRVS